MPYTKKHITHLKQNTFNHQVVFLKKGNLNLMIIENVFSFGIHLLKRVRQSRIE